MVAKYKIGPVFTPPVVSKLDGPLATLTLGTASGGTNWPGASYDPETHTVYAYACNACLTPIGLVPSPKEVSDMKYVMGTAGQQVRASRAARARTPAPIRRCRRRSRSGGAAGGGGGYSSALTVQGLPLIKPPYGTISAINLDNGEIVWQIAARRYAGRRPQSSRR